MTSGQQVSSNSTAVTGCIATEKLLKINRSLEISLDMFKFPKVEIKGRGGLSETID